MHGTRGWAAVALGALVGAAGALGVQAAAPAGAQEAEFSVTPAQLQINQKISQAAVRRSNQSLNYLAPIRTAETDDADPGSNGVRRGTGRGWGTDQIADGAITRSKLAPSLAGAQPVWLAKTSNAPDATFRASSPAYSLTRVDKGNYRVDLATDLRTCSWTAAPTVDAGLPDAYSVRAALDTTDPERLIVQTSTSLGVPVDSGMTVQVLC